MKFTEEKLEKAFTELLGQEGFPHHMGITISRKPDEILIEEDLQNFLLNQYASQGITVNEVKSIILQLKSLPASDLYESNKTFLKMLSDGFILKREDRTQKDIYIQLINFAGLNKHRQPEAEQLISVAAEPEEQYPPDTNIYKFVNQLEIIGTEKRIPDGIVYINGLPLVVFEFKSAIREEATIFDAFKQLTVRYRRDIPELFKYNTFCVISDGVNNKAGSFFALTIFSMPGAELLVWQKMWTALTVCLHSCRECLIKTACVILFATSFTFQIRAKKKKKLFVAIRNITLQELYLILSRKPRNPKVTEKAELISGQQVQEKAIQCFILPVC